MTNLVNWDNISPDYKDTGEGGMFAYAVVLTEENSFPPRREGGCNVDTVIVMSAPDSQVSGPDLWEEVWATKGYPGTGDPVLAAVFLGSTNRSLSRGGGYYNVWEEDLTDAGKQIVKSLEAVGPVQILTFLDT